MKSSRYGLGELSPYLEVTYAPKDAFYPSEKIFAFQKNTGETHLFASNATSILKASTENEFLPFYSISNYDQHGVAFNGRYYFTTTTNGLLVTDGDSIRAVDYSAPFSFTLATYNAGINQGLSVGTYNYSYSIIDNLGESYIATATTAYIATSSWGVVISINANDSASWNSFYVYRSLVNPATASDDYYFILNTASGVLTDNYSDVVVALNHFAPINRPPKANLIYVLKNRLWLGRTTTYNNYVFSSSPIDPEGIYSPQLYWELDYPYTEEAQSNIFPVDAPGGVTGLSDLFDTLLVFTPYSIFAGVGDNPSDPAGFYFKKTSSKAGTRSHETIAKAEEDVFFLSADGRIASFNGRGNRGNDSYTFDMLKADYIGDLIDTTAKSVNLNAIDSASGLYQNNKYFCSFPVNNATSNNIVVVYENKLPAFSKYSLTVRNFAEVDQDVYICDSATGFVNKFNSGYSDGIEVIPVSYSTKWIVLQDAYQDKKLLELWFKFKAESSIINYAISKDFGEEKVSGSFSTTGTGEYIYKVNGIDLQKLGRFKRVKFTFRNEIAGQGFQLQGIRGSYDYYGTPN
jgi:hypothetical protein